MSASKEVLILSQKLSVGPAQLLISMKGAEIICDEIASEKGT